MAIYGINEKFSKEEWEILQSIKLRSGLTWHNFIMKVAKDWAESKDKTIYHNE